MALHLPVNDKTRMALIITTAVACLVAWVYLANSVFISGLGINETSSLPVDYFRYLVHYGNDKRVAMWAAIGGGVGLIPSIVILYLFIADFGKRSLHGDAKLATLWDIKRAGLFGSQGILLGKFSGKYLLFGGAQHVSVSAPTRSGKGVSIVIPNLLLWNESVVALDIKRENFDITSKYRKHHGQAVFIFDPASPSGSTHRYNPLTYINANPTLRIDDVQKIAQHFFPDQEKVDPIWTATPRLLFMGVVLFLIESRSSLFTVGQILRESYMGGDAVDYFKNEIEKRNAANNPLSPACISGLMSYCGIDAPNTRSGVMTTFRSRLELWQNPLIDAATSLSDFDLRDVRKKKMSIYVAITPDNLARMAPIVNLFFSQLIDVNTRELPQQNKQLKYTCLLLLDEFTAPGPIRNLIHGISFIAGYGLRVLHIIQSPNQLRATYGADNAKTFLTNHAAQVFFAPKSSENDVAKEISEWLGFETVKSASESRSTEFFKKRNRAESVSDQRRALFLPQEVTSIGATKAIISIENVRPIIANKAQYFLEEDFMSRLKKVSPMLRNIKRKLPTHDDLIGAMISGELSVAVAAIDLEGHKKIVEKYVAAQRLSANANTVSVETKRETVLDDLDAIDRVNFNLNLDVFKSIDLNSFDDASMVAFADKYCEDNTIGI